MYVYQTCGSSLVFHFILMNQERTQTISLGQWTILPYPSFSPTLLQLELLCSLSTSFQKNFSSSYFADQPSSPSFTTFFFQIRGMYLTLQVLLTCLFQKYLKTLTYTFILSCIVLPNAVQILKKLLLDDLDMLQC